MKKFETVISVFNHGCDLLDAGERAGEIFDVSKIEDGVTLSCDPTHYVEDEYITLFHITNSGVDLFDAGERAGDIIDSKRFAKDMYICCEPTREVVNKRDEITVENIVGRSRSPILS